MPRHPTRAANEVTAMIKTKLKINGMACSMCESHINDAVRNAFDVKKVSSSHTKGETVIISDTALDENRLKDVISATGYEVVSVGSEPYEKRSGFSLFKKH